MKKRFIFLLIGVTSFFLANSQIGIHGPDSLPNVGSIQVAGSYAGGTFMIKSRSTQKCLTVQAGNINPGAIVNLGNLNGAKSQKFTFEKIDDNYYYIRTNTGGLYLTLVKNISTSDGSGTGTGVSFTLKQENLYNSSPTDAAVLWPKAGSQKWKILPSNDETCVLITNKNLVSSVLDADNPTSLTYRSKTGNNQQQWILKQASLKESPNSSKSEYRMIPDCYYTASAYWFFHETLPNLAKILPEWRPVGDLNTPSGPNYHPLNAYEILEGRVTTAHVTHEDVPLSHYTHDFNFDVKPDPLFKYLLANRDGTMQEHIEVEWETGIAQGDNRIKNPAATPNRKGDSFGFFSAGHKRQDIIWNWPTVNDWVHVEGQWIWDRGHPPSSTEIHPPRFVAIQRNLPEKYKPGTSTNYFFATRCDLFASGDGSAIMNNRGLESFAEKVKMSQRNYTVTFKHLIPKPNNNAQLTVAFQTQNGDNFPFAPIVEVYANGTADVPEPHVIVTIPWASRNVEDRKIFARSIYIYWNDAPTHGIPPSYRLKAINVTLDSIFILRKEEGNDSDNGEFRMFANIGNKWIFLNEFCPDEDILSNGLGDVTDPITKAVRPDVTGKSSFNFNQTFEIYLPQGNDFRCYVSGWEDDYMGGHFGELLSPYASCDEAKRFLDSHFDGEDASEQGKHDDPIGEVKVIIPFSNIPLTLRQNSKGRTGEASDVFKAIFKLKIQ